MRTRTELANAGARGSRGFTLIELVIVVVIVAILGGLAYPSMINLMLKHRVQDAATDLFAALFKTRSEALKRVSQITLLPSTGTDWTTGWQVQDAASNVLDSHLPTQRITITTVPANLAAVTYSASGRVVTSAPTFVLSASSGGYSCSYTVTVDPSGRPYQTTSRTAGTNEVAAGGGVSSC